MILDMSHINDKSFWDVMDVAAGPVVATPTPTAGRSAARPAILRTNS